LYIFKSAMSPKKSKIIKQDWKRKINNAPAETYRKEIASP
jgi:hypothetical protein